jgi:hydrogenase-4 component F
MNPIPFIVVAFAGTALAIATRRNARLTAIVGVVALAGCVATALAIEPGRSVAVGGGGLIATEYTRAFLLLGSLVGLGLAVSGLAGGSRRDAPAVTLAVLGAAALTLELLDTGAAFLAATAGGLFGVLLTLVPRGARAGATVGIVEARAVVVAGALGVAATAWFAREVTALDQQPVVFGLAYLAVAVAVAIRFGAVPFHLWAARLTDVVPETTLPILTALAPASLAIVVLAWIETVLAPLAGELEVERLLVLGIAVATVVLASIAAFVQDDLEHLLGYAIVADAAVVILALAAISPEARGPAQTWILAFVTGRGALAAWAAGIRAGLTSGRITDLRGWARRSPILGSAFVVIAVAGIGFPGLAAFDARATLVELAVPGEVAIAVWAAMLAPVAYYVRLVIIGLGRPDHSLLEPRNAWRPRADRPMRTGMRRWATRTWDRNRPFTTALVAALLGVLALASAAGLFVPADAAGSSHAAWEPTRTEILPTGHHSSGASTQRSMSRS